MKEIPAAFLHLVKLLEEAVGHKTGYALLDPFSCTTLENGRPAVVPIQNAGRIISQHIGLADYMFVIAVTAQKPNVAGHIELDHSGRDVFVELSPEICEHKDAVLATLCHELSHKFLHEHGIRNGTVTIEQEFLTDVTAVYLGLGKIMLNGCECQSSRRWTQGATTSSETRTLRTGYVSRDCFAFVYRLVCAMRGIPSEKLLGGLSAAAREAVRSAELNYADWFDPGFSSPEGAAMMSSALTAVVEACQDDSAGRHRTLRRADERLRSTKTNLNESHKPLLEAQELIARIAEPEPNPHLTFLKCLQTRESVTELVSQRNLKMRDVLVGWNQIEGTASIKHEAAQDSITEVVECPLDGSKLRVPRGRKRLLVTCPSCKYKFMANTCADAGAPEAKQKAKSTFRWMPHVALLPATCLSVALLVFVSVAWQRHTLSTMADKSRLHTSTSSNAITDRFVPDNHQSSSLTNRSDPMSGSSSAAADAHPSQRQSQPLELSTADVEIDYLAGKSSRSLPTGTRFAEDRAATGHGELEVNNGTQYDACLVVVDVTSQTRVRNVYIKAHDSLTLGHLASGQYSILFTTGEDWDDSTEEFTRHASYFEFGKSVDFEETSDSQAIRYERHAITLQPVPSGNMPTSSLTKSQFLSLAGKT